jgi:uncharacterized protein YjbJ (UPF0337 family)
VSFLRRQSEDLPLDCQGSFWTRPKSRTGFHQIKDACEMVDRPFRFSFPFLNCANRRFAEARIVSMKSSTKDRAKGRINEAKGKVKEEVGKTAGDPNLRDRGTAEKVSGKVQRKIGEVKKVFGE